MVAIFAGGCGTKLVHRRGLKVVDRVDAACEHHLSLLVVCLLKAVHWDQ
jgi:hypothetical protein